MSAELDVAKRGEIERMLLEQYQEVKHLVLNLDGGDDLTALRDVLYNLRNSCRVMGVEANFDGIDMPEETAQVVSPQVKSFTRELDNLKNLSSEYIKQAVVADLSASPTEKKALGKVRTDLIATVLDVMGG